MILNTSYDYRRNGITLSLYQPYEKTRDIWRLKIDLLGKNKIDKEFDSNESAIKEAQDIMLRNLDIVQGNIMDFVPNYYDDKIHLLEIQQDI